MSNKLKVGIIFGGRSAEHEVSLRSAKNIFEAIDKDKYEPVLIGMDKKGEWFLIESLECLVNSDDPKLIKLNSQAGEKIVLVPQGEGRIAHLVDANKEARIDVAFPILHGPFGEDGTMQGLLKLAHIPFVGAGVLGSAIGMDKDVMKRLLREAGLPIGKFLAVKAKDALSYEEAVERLGSPFFVKPANLGSSVGVSKVSSAEDFDKAMREAFKYDAKIIIEENIKGREIECSVLGNDEPMASVPGEVIPRHDFYSYEAKYIDENGAGLEIPAKLPAEIAEQVKAMAIKTFQVLACEGFGRVDFFLKDNGDILVNEINTIPGFTSISMYPKMWEASGLSYTELIDRLIQLAVERFEREKELKTVYSGE